MFRFLDIFIFLQTVIIFYVLCLFYFQQFMWCVTGGGKKSAILSPISFATELTNDVASAARLVCHV